MDEKPEQIHEKFVKAFNSQDVDALAALYEPDALLVTRRGPARGREAIRAAYLAYMALKPRIELYTLGAFRAGDLALLFGRWKLQGTGPDGAPVHNEGHNAETVRRQPGGSWLFVIDQPSAPQ
jgi:uncharacterized protein (TIGR02246 family)